MSNNRVLKQKQMFVKTYQNMLIAYNSYLTLDSRDIIFLMSIQCFVASDRSRDCGCRVALGLLLYRNTYTLYRYTLYTDTRRSNCSRPRARPQSSRSCHVMSCDVMSCRVGSGQVPSATYWRGTSELARPSARRVEPSEPTIPRSILKHICVLCKYFSSDIPAIMHITVL